MNAPEPTVDVAINVYGKPYQTAVTLFSLLRYSGKWINKIYFIEENKQPHSSNFRFILKALQDKIIYYKPYFWLNVKQTRTIFLSIRPYRHAIRYQYAWEKSTAKHLLILHNDVLFKGDLVEQYLQQSANHTGIGKIGQCWNCPASYSSYCQSDNYTNYQPSYNEVISLSENYFAPRKSEYKTVLTQEHPWPLPECRLNEFVALINLEKARPATIPIGKASPFGSFHIDIGVKWFRELNINGHTFKHFNYDPYATHAWASQNGAGNDSLRSYERYLLEEKSAFELLKKEFPEYLLEEQLS